MIRIALVAILATGCAATPAQQARVADATATTEAKLVSALHGYTAGSPQSCIDRRRAVGMEAYGDTLVYKFSNRLLYRTKTSGGCFGLDRGNALVVRSPSTQLCSGDFATSLDTIARIESGNCVFGDFTPYTRL